MAIIGIDLGTTNSLVSCFKDNKVILIPNQFGSFLTPSVVAVDGDITYVGKIAKARLVTHPESTFASFKRYMGSTHTFQVKRKTYTPEMLSALVLANLKQDAQRFLGEEITEAVISVPAYFNDDQRKATKVAAEMAGLVVERVINEPSAAALAARTLHDKNDCVMLVVDLGGGTLDVSLVECFENIVSVLAVSGDNHLGGDDFDMCIAREFAKQNNIDFDKLDGDSKSVLMKAAENCKISLSSEENAVMSLNTPVIQGEMSISRGQLVKICAELFNRIKKTIWKVLGDNKIGIGEISDVVLVGGGSKVTVVSQFVSHIMSCKPIYLGEPDEIVANGVGIYAGIKSRDNDIKQVLLTDICPFSLGVGVQNPDKVSDDLFSVIIERNTVLPVSMFGNYRPAHPSQKSVALKIYQGEHMKAGNNLLLGELQVRVPQGPDNNIKVRFTYDINGILEVEATPSATGEPVVVVLTSPTANGYSQKEIEEKAKALEQFKNQSKEDDEVKLLISTAEALFAQASGKTREHIEGMLHMFLSSLNRTSSLNEKQKLKKAFYKRLKDISDDLNFDYFEDTQEEGWSWYDQFNNGSDDDDDDDDFFDDIDLDDDFDDD